MERIGVLISRPNRLHPPRPSRHLVALPDGDEPGKLRFLSSQARSSS
jgi:hypothetical protein